MDWWLPDPCREKPWKGSICSMRMPKSTAAPTWARDTMTKQASVAQANGDARNNIVGLLNGLFLPSSSPRSPQPGPACGWLVLLLQVLCSDPLFQPYHFKSCVDPSRALPMTGQSCVSRLSVDSHQCAGLASKKRRQRRRRTQEAMRGRSSTGSLFERRHVAAPPSSASLIFLSSHFRQK
ncbi:hypothetical protein HDV57DRAFT_193611 [Trichoderma longibrachiatum]